jgi:hypothetical protein
VSLHSSDAVGQQEPFRNSVGIVVFSHDVANSFDSGKALADALGGQTIAVLADRSCRPVLSRRFRTRRGSAGQAVARPRSPRGRWL